MTDKIHRITSTIVITGLCRSTIYESVRKGTFPEPVRLGQRAIGWRESELMTWVASRPTRHSTVPVTTSTRARGSK